MSYPVGAYKTNELRPTDITCPICNCYFWKAGPAEPGLHPTLLECQDCGFVAKFMKGAVFYDIAEEEGDE